MKDAVKKTFLVKIIPPGGCGGVPAGVHAAATWRAAGGLALLLLLGAAGVHTYQLRVAEANVRALQAVTAAQQAQLRRSTRRPTRWPASCGRCRRRTPRSGA